MTDSSIKIGDIIIFYIFILSVFVIFFKITNLRLYYIFKYKMSKEINNPYQIETELFSMIKDVKQYNHNNGVWEKSIIPNEKFAYLMKSKYEYLYKSSEGLFAKCLNNDFREKRNLVRIEEMLKHLKNIYNGNIDRDTVDKQLGAKYAKEYVEPLINKDKKC
jgi:hypothetical protein